jgi:hypothetical protein
MAQRSFDDQICCGDRKTTDIRIAKVCSNNDALLDTPGIPPHARSVVYVYR